jgi:hypothetical protein
VVHYAVDVVGLVAEKENGCARIGGDAEIEVRLAALHVIRAADPDAV